MTKTIQQLSIFTFFLLFMASCSVIKKPVALKYDDAYAPINTKESFEKYTKKEPEYKPYNTTANTNTCNNNNIYANRFNRFNNRFYMSGTAFMRPSSMYSPYSRFGINPYQSYSPYYSNYSMPMYGMFYPQFGYNNYGYNPYGYNNYNGRNSNYYGTSGGNTYSKLSKGRRISAGRSIPSQRKNNTTTRPVRRGSNTTTAPTRRSPSYKTTPTRRSAPANSGSGGSRSSGSKSSGGRGRR